GQSSCRIPSHQTQFPKELRNQRQHSVRRGSRSERVRCHPRQSSPRFATSISSSGIEIVRALHEVNRADRYADRLAFMNGARLLVNAHSSGAANDDPVFGTTEVLLQVGLAPWIGQLRSFLPPRKSTVAINVNRCLQF